MWISTRSSSTALVFGAVMVAILSGLSGCGQDDSPSSADSPTPSQQSPAASKQASPTESDAPGSSSSEDKDKKQKPKGQKNTSKSDPSRSSSSQPAPDPNADTPNKVDGLDECWDEKDVAKAVKRRVYLSSPKGITSMCIYSTTDPGSGSGGQAPGSIYGIGVDGAAAYEEIEQLVAASAQGADQGSFTSAPALGSGGLMMQTGSLLNGIFKLSDTLVGVVTVADYSQPNTSNEEEQSKIATRLAKFLRKNT